MTIVMPGLKAGRSLVSAQLYETLTSRVAAEEGLGQEKAGRVVDQALAFLGTCAGVSAPLSPSEQVDPGWHAFLLHTQDYLEFCERIAGRFIHHVPLSAETSAAGGAAAREAIGRTVAAIRRAGFVVEEELWEAAPGSCSQCHQGCTDSPR